MSWSSRLPPCGGSVYENNRPDSEQCTRETTVWLWWSKTVERCPRCLLLLYEYETMRLVPLIRSYVASLSRLRRYDVSSFYSRSTSSTIVNRDGGKVQDGPTVDNDDDGFRFPQPEFNNTRLIYASKSTAELVRAYFVFGACSFDVLVNNQVKVTHNSAQLLLVCRRF